MHESDLRADGPRIVSPPLHAALALGDRTELSCAADSNPPASLAFYRGAQPSRDSAATPLAVSRAGEGALTLSLVALNASFFGDYWCVASLSGFPHDTARAVLKVCKAAHSHATHLCLCAPRSQRGPPPLRCSRLAGTRRASVQEHGQRALRRCASPLISCPLLFDSYCKTAASDANAHMQTRAGLGEEARLNCVAEVVPLPNASRDSALQWTRNGSAVQTGARHFVQQSTGAPFSYGLQLVISNVQVRLVPFDCAVQCRTVPSITSLLAVSAAGGGLGRVRVRRRERVRAPHARHKSRA